MHQKTIQELSQELKTEKYKCTPILKVFISKNVYNKEEKRPIGIPSIKDKLVQTVMK
jgi:retron-type reverse transcriptase